MGKAWAHKSVYQDLKTDVTKMWPIHLLCASKALPVCRPATIKPLTLRLLHFWILLELFFLHCSMEHMLTTDRRWLREISFPNIMSYSYLSELGSIFCCDVLKKWSLRKVSFCPPPLNASTSCFVWTNIPYHNICSESDFWTWGQIVLCVHTSLLLYINIWLNEISF